MTMLILGAGVSGTAASRLARSRDLPVLIYDENPDSVVELRKEGVETVAGPWERRLMTGIETVVASPGFSEVSRPIHDCLTAGLPVWSEVEFAASYAEAPLIAVTGTNGKTTTTLLIAEMLSRSGHKAAAVGNIGTALSDVADEPWDVLVVEVSSFQLRFIADFHPDIAVVLNVAEDHLDWHGSIEAYRDAKARISENQGSDDLLIYNADDAGASHIAVQAPTRTMPLRAPGLLAEGPAAALRAGGALVPRASLFVSDPAYLMDFAAAAEAAAAAGAKPEGIYEALVAFRPAEHRRTLVAERRGVAWVDDSKATNPHAALASISAYPSVVLIAGGRNKGLELAPVVAHPNLKAVVAIGEVQEELIGAADVTAYGADGMQEAVKIAAGLARSGDTVLLAPACASFDMFSSYSERGEAFADAILRKDL
ncbi:MAG: UDP-N-acetylmuramoyl-L-alanine--D-glutamate ligase [Acidimicrobiia bacterium]